MMRADRAGFLSIFLCKLALGLVGFPGKPWFGFLVLGARTYSDGAALSCRQGLQRSNSSARSQNSTMSLNSARRSSTLPVLPSWE